MPVFQFEYEEFQSQDELRPSFQELLTAARNACQHAHAPYSHFFVGSAVLMKNGRIVTGFNIENASYPVGICAERTALASAIAQFPEDQIEAIAISYQSEIHPSERPAFPCGMCRQFISECEDRNQKAFPLILAGEIGPVVVVKTIKNLLPFYFGGKDLSE
jgi:cytidine deaminase